MRTACEPQKVPLRGTAWDVAPPVACSSTSASARITDLGQSPREVRKVARSKHRPTNYSQSFARRHAALNGVCERLVDDTTGRVGRQVIMQARTKSFFFVHRHAVDQFALRSYRHSVRVPEIVEIGKDDRDPDHL